MGSRSDDAYWESKYAEAHCYDHPEAEMWYYGSAGIWICDDCEDEDEDGTD